MAVSCDLKQRKKKTKRRCDVSRKMKICRTAMAARTEGIRLAAIAVLH